MIKNGFQTWGHKRSWVAQQYVDGRIVWESRWCTSEEQAEIELKKHRNTQPQLLGRES